MKFIQGRISTNEKVLASYGYFLSYSSKFVLSKKHQGRTSVSPFIYYLSSMMIEQKGKNH